MEGEGQVKGCRLVVLLVVLGVIFMALLVVVPVIVERIVTSQVLAQVIVTSNTSATYPLWASNNGPNTAPPEFFKVYVFNVTNAEQVLKGDEVLHALCCSLEHAPCIAHVLPVF